MARGFIFDSGKCVRCNACRAACMLENGIKARHIFTWNEDANPGLPVFNLSLACNHCENPSCIKACPANCYTRDESSGAILLDQDKCLGCKYCAWNCPYKAPRFNKEKKLMQKCNLCYSAVNAGEMPACTNSCPTGALSFGELSSENRVPQWFTLKNLRPSITFAGKTEIKNRTVPVSKFESLPEKRHGMRWKKSDASLAVFTFLATLLVSIVSAAMFSGKYPDDSIIILLSLAAASVSLFHLGKPLKAWKSISNLRSSPLSREIFVFIIFSLLSIAGTFFASPEMLIFASATGLILLLIIDSVYNHVCSSSWLHSGQTFLTSLLLVSYLTSSMIPFTFIVMVKLTMSVLLLIKKRDVFPGIRYIRGAVLFLVWAGLISGSSQPDRAMLIILLIGEIADRFLFYADFEPENIRKMISKNLKQYINEEKRS